MKHHKEKLVNPKKSVFLFSKEKPKGEMFNFVNGKENDEYKDMLENGWFDSPARLNLPKENDVGITIEQAQNANPTDLVKLVESFGFIVMTPEQMKAEAVKMAMVALDISKFSDEEFITEAERRGLKEPDQGQDADELMMAAFKEDPKSLTKAELAIFGNKLYSLGLRENMLEDTLITKIQEAMAA